MSDGSPIRTVLDKLTGVMPSGDSGKQYVACCPVHGDQHQSMGVAEGRDGRVLIRCYAGCERKDILAAIGLEFRDLFPGRVEKPTPAGVSVGSLAFEKRIPVDFLRKVCGLTDRTGGKNGRYILIPYKDVENAPLFERHRYGPGSDRRFWQPTGVSLRAYGLWRLADYRTSGGTLILTEGESDAWTLWLHDYPTLGVPGAQAIDSVTADDITGFDTIYIWQDGDTAGGKFVAQMAAHVAKLRPGVTVKVLSSTEAKDPNELLQRFGEGEAFKAKFGACLAAAVDPNPVKPEDASTGEKFYLTDIGNAKRMVRDHQSGLRFSHTQNSWYTWTGERWAMDETGEVVRRAKTTVHSIFAEASEAATAGSPERAEELSRHAIRSQSAKSVGAMIKLAESEVGIPVSTGSFDADPFLFNCANGTIDLRTGELQPYRREDYLTTLSGVNYYPDEKTPMWDRFLTRTFSSDAKQPDSPPNADLIDFLQRLLGYCITADIREQVLPVMWGGGSNGKSTFLNIVRAIFGSGYYSKAPRALLMARKTESHPTELTVLDGMRLVVATESAQDQRLSEDLVKDLTGGEGIKARRMRENFYEFEPTHKVILCTNHRPRIVDTDDGIWRRLILIPFLTKFWNPAKGEVGPEHLQQDKTLFDQMRVEFPGILAWIVRGCLEWQKSGLQAPKFIQDETMAYREDEDQIQHFLSECCEVSNAAGNTPLKEVYAKFSEWCGENGYRPGSNRRLKAGLIGHGVVVKNGTGHKVTCFGLKATAITKEVTEKNREPVRSLSDLDD